MLLCTCLPIHKRIASATTATPTTPTTSASRTTTQTTITTTTTVASTLQLRQPTLEPQQQQLHTLPVLQEQGGQKAATASTIV